MIVQSLQDLKRHYSIPQRSSPISEETHGYLGTYFILISIFQFTHTFSGYSVTSGKFKGKTGLQMVIGGPRANQLFGLVSSLISSIRFGKMRVGFSCFVHVKSYYSGENLLLFLKSVVF